MDKRRIFGVAEKNWSLTWTNLIMLAYTRCIKMPSESEKGSEERKTQNRVGTRVIEAFCQWNDNLARYKLPGNVILLIADEWSEFCYESEIN